MRGNCQPFIFGKLEGAIKPHPKVHIDNNNFDLI